MTTWILLCSERKIFPWWASQSDLRKPFGIKFLDSQFCVWTYFAITGAKLKELTAKNKILAEFVQSGKVKLGKYCLNYEKYWRG